MIFPTTPQSFLFSFYPSRIAVFSAQHPSHIILTFSPNSNARNGNRTPVSIQTPIFTKTWLIKRKLFSFVF